MTNPIPSVLILTPVKDAVRHLPRYVERLERLTYPRDRLTLGMLEGDSRDDTYGALSALRGRLEQRFAKVTLVKRDLGFRLPEGIHRATPAFQLARRTTLARARNTLLMRALDDEDWVLWLDVDVIDYPADIIEKLIAFDLDILQPHCVTDFGGPTFDRNAWAERGTVHMDGMRGRGRPVRLDAVGGTMLLVRADVHRDGLIFPPFRFGAASAAVRDPHPEWVSPGEVETEGLGIMAREMSRQCWGLPDLEIRHAPE